MASRFSKTTWAESLPLDSTSFSTWNSIQFRSRIALLNQEARAEIEATVRAIHKIETAIEPRFQEHFVNASAIPNSAEPFPILATEVTLPDVNFNTGADAAAASGGGRRRRRRG